MCDVTIDFVSTLVDSFSPFSYTIVMASNSGVETVLRYTQKCAHILEGI